MKKIVPILCLLFFAGSPALLAQSRDTVLYSRDSLLVAHDSIPAVKDSLAAGNAVSKSDSLQKAKAAKKKLYSIPRRAAVLSAVCPGLGQAYNKKYWKIPIIYAGIGAFGYLFVTNNKQYNYYRKNLKAFYDTDSNTVNTSGYSGEQLQTLKLQYRKSRDLGIIGMSLIYLFNIIDANVDGHLRTFDVSDDLSLQIDPWQNIYRSAYGYKTAAGLSLKLTFK